MKRPEENLHRQVAAWLRAACPDLLWYHPANGGARSRVEGAIFKALGVRAGTPDLAIVLPGGRAAFIELKADRGRQSPTQQAFEADALACGALYAVCRSLAEVEAVLTGWGVQPRGRIAA